MEIRSYRRVFDLERRVYRIDHLRLNPNGVPVRGIVYSLGALACVLVCARLPLVGMLMAPTPWFLRDLLLPLLCGALLTVVRIDGRRFDHAARALTSYALGPRRPTSLCASGPIRLPTKWHPSALLMLPDGSDGRLRRLRFAGPGVARVLVRHACEHSCRRSGVSCRRHSRLVLHGVDGDRARDGERVIVLDRGASLTTR